ncbi:MAG: subclass B3 metallo-beta-lactamase [Parasphingorhabdus sp.]|uniref:subclass B3 metallo-beta-lactamase n=1 Tax=Parasphingorhabdus sp. TaxID=2709688 RepID=UPI003297A790
MKMRLAGLTLLTFSACTATSDNLNSAAQGGDVETASAARTLAENKVSTDALAKWRSGNPSWYAPVPPFQLIGDKGAGVYYVGTKSLGMFFIPTSQGHIVIDGGMPDQGTMVADAIVQLGYDPKDIKILLNSHAHLDHSGGLAALKAMSGAQLVASEGDRSALEGGFYLGSEEDVYLFAPPVKVDRIIDDRETVTLGDVTLTAHLHPGHTRGCTSWMMTAEQSGQSYELLFFCSATVAANRLIDPPQYENIVDDYRLTFAKARKLKPDVFLANHPGFFGLSKKRQMQKAGNPLAFVDDQHFGRFIVRSEQAFEAALAKQTAAAQSRR